MNFKLGDKVVWVTHFSGVLSGEVIEVFSDTNEQEIVIHWENGRKLGYDKRELKIRFGNELHYKIQYLRNQKLNQLLD